jgi:hypothetical protein
MRTAVLISSLLATACTVGELGTGDGGSTSNACVERITPPSVAHKHKDDGTAHAKRGCVAAACHLAAAPGIDAPAYQFGGTVFKADGITPSAGVTVHVKSKSGMVATGVTDDAGNFNIPADSLPDPFPATVTATACPTLSPMVAPLAAGGGDCNSGSCHGGATAVIMVAD